jgi:hypothetical protein
VILLPHQLPEEDWGFSISFIPWVLSRYLEDK